MLRRGNARSEISGRGGLRLRSITDDRRKIVLTLLAVVSISWSIMITKSGVIRFARRQNVFPGCFSLTDKLPGCLKNARFWCACSMCIAQGVRNDIPSASHPK
jgi:hypothetical protein